MTTTVETYDVLGQRGIKQAAVDFGNWKNETVNGAPGWSYPVFDRNGGVVARRWKAAGSDHDPKYLWRGSKNGQNYYILPLTIEAIKASDGVAYIASGEPDVLAYRAAGIANVLCWFGEGQTPKTLADDLISFGVTRAVHYPDMDDTGRRAAASIAALLQGKIEYQAYLLPASLGEKGDINKLWIDARFDRDDFRRQLNQCQPLPIGTKKVVTTPPPRDKELPADFLRAIEAALHAGGYGADGWSKAMPCIFKQHEHDDNRPAAAWHREKNIYKCMKCSEAGQDFWLAKDVAARLGIRIQDYTEPAPASKNGKVKLEDAPGDDSQQQLHKPTDDELAEIVMQQWAGDYRFFRSVWHKYSQGYWQSLRNVNPFIRNVMMSHKKSGIKPSKAKAGSIEWFLQTELELIDENSIDQAPEYLNLSNGLFNLETGQLESHRRDIYVTTKLDYPYDPEAECPIFNQFLNTMLVTPDGKTDWQLIQMVQEAFYYSLTADMSRRVSFWVVGPTGSGKSTLINLLVGLMKAYHTTVDLNQIGTNRFILSQVAGKRLVTFGEADANTKLADGIYKMLVSSDEIIADVKNKEPIKFRSQAKIWWGMNNMPVLADRSGAVDVRVLIIPMRHSLAREKWDYYLDQKLYQERSGILNWALFGGKRLARAGDFTHVIQVEQAREEFKADNDVELTFIQEWAVREGKTPAQLLYTAYRTWCLKNGHTPKSSTKVARDWQRLGFAKVKTMDSNCYEGVSLTSEALKAIVYG